MICIKKLRSLRSLVAQEQKVGCQGPPGSASLRVQPCRLLQSWKNTKPPLLFWRKTLEIPCHIRDLPKKEFTNVNQGFALRYFNRENDYFKAPLII